MCIIYGQFDFVHDVMTKNHVCMYVLLLVKVSLCIALFAKRGSGCVLPRQSMHEQGMRVVPQNPSIHRFMQGQWSPGQVFFFKKLRCYAEKFMSEKFENVQTFQTFVDTFWPEV